jgi:alkaline phosphatase D
VEVEGLSPAREYWYRFWAGGEASPVGRTLTAHPPDSPMDRFRFAFVSCQNYEHGYFTAFRHLTEDRPDLLVHLGDYIYERRFGADPVREAPGGEVFTLDEYRMRYTTYRNDPDLQAAHAVCPWVATNDDHEVENNYADAIAEDERVPPDQFLLRRAAAYQAYYEFMPFRRSSMPVGPDMQLYRRLRFGSLLSLHVLDTRQYRDDQPCGDGTKPLCAEAVAPSRHLLGTTQESWLMDGLREVGPRWNCLANQVMMARVERDSPDGPRYPLDQWAGYPVARDRMLRFLESTRPSNPVVITGDIHSNWVSDLKADFDRPGSAVVGAEFVGTSIASGGDGNDSSGSTTLDQNPHLKFYNARRGYVLNTITPARWTADYRTVEYVSRPGSPVETKASFVVEDGRPGSLAG